MKNEHIEFDELYRHCGNEVQGEVYAKKRRRNCSTLLSAKKL